MKKVFIIIGLVVSFNAFAFDPYLQEMRNQTLLMQRQQFDDQRYRQQQQLNYNAQNRRGLDANIILQSNTPDYADAYAEGVAQGQRQRLMALEIERLEAEAEAREAASIRANSEARQAELLEAARARQEVPDITPEDIAEYDASQAK